MDTTTILPTPPTSGAIVQSSGSNDFFSTWAGIEATNRNGAMNLKAIGDASIADINATNLASVANLNATNLNGVSVTPQRSQGLPLPIGPYSSDTTLTLDCNNN